MIKKILSKLDSYLYNPKIFHCMKFITFLILLVLSFDVFAEDLLEGTTEDTKDTISGAGKFYAITIEAVIGLANFIRNKNVLQLTGIIVVSLFINIYLGIV